MRTLLLGVLLALTLTSARAADAPAVDLARYMGDWYEIAHLPNYPQRGCVDTTVHYKLAEGGGFELVNSCVKDGKLKEYHGRARPLTAGATDKFRVRFFLLISADYWIVDLDPNYRWAAVGGAKRDQFWVISRTPALDDAVYQGILTRAKAMGYDLSKLEKTVLSAPAR